MNSNIRCIEIVKHKMAVEHFLRWIVTLDVLKCVDDYIVQESNNVE